MGDLEELKTRVARSRRQDRLRSSPGRVLDLLAGPGCDRRRTKGSLKVAAVVADLLCAGIRIPASLAAEWLALGRCWGKTFLRRWHAGTWIRARGGPGEGPTAYTAALVWLRAAALERWGALPKGDGEWWARQIAAGAEGMRRLRAGVMYGTTACHWTRVRHVLADDVARGGFAGVDLAEAERTGRRLRRLEKSRRR